MFIIRRAVHGTMIAAVLIRAPAQSLIVEIRDRSEYAPNEEVLFYKADQPLDLSFCKRVQWLTQLRLKADGLHKGFVIPLPDGMPFRIATGHNALHVVRQHVLRNAQIDKRMDHSDEEVFLLSVRKELHIPLAAVMADHGKAGNLIRATHTVHDFHKSPVHLERFARAGFIPPPSVPLWCDELSLGRQEVLVLSYIVTHHRLASAVSLFADAVVTDNRVLYTVTKKIINDTGIS